MLKFKLGCYKSYPLTGISSRDSRLASKEIRIGLELKAGCYNSYPLTGTDVLVGDVLVRDSLDIISSSYYPSS